MTLHKRLAKLEAQRQVLQTGPRVIVYDIVWRTDDGGVQSIGALANVLTGSGWETITRKNDEAEAEFQHRVAALAGDVEAGSAWSVAALPNKQAAHDPA